VRQRLRERFDVREFEVCEGSNPAQCARDAIAAGAELVIAAGGDGTVSGVAGQLLDTGVPLGVIPLGTSNSFAAALGIPGEWQGAVETLAADHRRVIDTARCENDGITRTMILHGSIGFHTEAEVVTSKEAKQRWGQLAYIANAVLQLGELPEFQVELESFGHVVRCTATAVAVANVVPRKTFLAHGPSTVDPSDGLLDVTIIAMRSITEALATGVHLLRQAAVGDAAQRDNIGYFACKRVRITTDPPMRVLIDGEEAGMSPLYVESRPGSLVVVAPPPAAEDVRDEPEVKLEGLPGLEVTR
jgi:YegS/Rv2252/BmrU family lipid kinase